MSKYSKNKRINKRTLEWASKIKSNKWCRSQLYPTNKLSIKIAGFGRSQSKTTIAPPIAVCSTLGISTSCRL